MIDQRFRGIAPRLRESDAVQTQVAAELPNGRDVLPALEIEQLTLASLGVTAVASAAEQGVDAHYLRTSARRRLGACTLPQAVYIGLNTGLISFEDLTDELPYKPATPGRFEMLCLSALGFRNKQRSELVGVRRSAAVAHLLLLKDWEVPSAEAAVRRAFETRLWVPKGPFASQSDATS